MSEEEKKDCIANFLRLIYDIQLEKDGSGQWRIGSSGRDSLLDVEFTKDKQKETEKMIFEVSKRSPGESTQPGLQDNSDAYNVAGVLLLLWLGGSRIRGIEHLDAGLRKIIDDKTLNGALFSDTLLEKLNIAVSMKNNFTEATVSEIFRKDKLGDDVLVCGGSGWLAVAEKIATVVCGPTAYIINKENMKIDNQKAYPFKVITGSAEENICRLIEESYYYNGQWQEIALAGIYVTGGSREAFVQAVIEIIKKFGFTDSDVREIQKIAKDTRDCPLSWNEDRRELFQEAQGFPKGFIEQVAEWVALKAKNNQNLKPLMVILQQIKVVDQYTSPLREQSEIVQHIGVEYTRNSPLVRKPNQSQANGRIVFDLEAKIGRGSNMQGAVRQLVINPEFKEEGFLIQLFGRVGRNDYGKMMPEIMQEIFNKKDTYYREVILDEATIRLNVGWDDEKDVSWFDEMYGSLMALGTFMDIERRRALKEIKALKDQIEDIKDERGKIIITKEQMRLQVGLWRNAKFMTLVQKTEAVMSKIIFEGRQVEVDALLDSLLEQASPVEKKFLANERRKYREGFYGGATPEFDERFSQAEEAVRMAFLGGVVQPAMRLWKHIGRTWVIRPCWDEIKIAFKKGKISSLYFGLLSRRIRKAASARQQDLDRIKPILNDSGAFNRISTTAYDSFADIDSTNPHINMMVLGIIRSLSRDVYPMRGRGYFARSKNITIGDKEAQVEKAKKVFGQIKGEAVTQQEEDDIRQPIFEMPNGNRGAPGLIKRFISLLTDTIAALKAAAYQDSTKINQFTRLKTV
jgi:hypothetical protein